MKLEIHRNKLRVVPEDNIVINHDERDTAFIEEVLGLKKAGDYVKLTRINATGLNSLACLETEPEQK